MLFLTRFIVAIATATVMSTAVYADGHESDLLSNFSIGAFSTGDVGGTGSSNTIFHAGKDAFNDVQLGTDTIGTGCGIECTATIGNAAAHVGEIAFLHSETDGDKSGELFGSSATLNLAAATELQVGDTILRDTSSVDAVGDVYGLGVGDHVSVVTQRESSAKVQHEMTFHGNLCGDTCGDVTQGTWAMGSMSQSANVAASGHETVAISNVTSGNVSALLQNYKGAGQ